MAGTVTGTADDGLKAINNLAHAQKDLITSVMGPDAETFLSEQITTELTKTIKHKLAGGWEADTPEAQKEKAKSLARLMIKDVIKPGIAQLTAKNTSNQNDIKKALQEADKALQEIKKLGTSTITTNKTERQRATDKLKDQLKTIQEVTTSMKQCEENITLFTREHSRLTIDYDTLSTDDTKKHGTLGQRIQDLKTAYKHLESELTQMHDHTLGGQAAMARTQKKDLALPDNLDNTSGKHITSAIKVYLRHRAQEYYIIMPTIECICDSYDPTDGTYYAPPSILDNYKKWVHDDSRAIYREQSKTLYCHILTILKETRMAKITQEFMCGINKTVKAKCGVDDGVMAIYCLLSKYGKDTTHDRDNLESDMMQAGTHFTWGNPINKIGHLRKTLNEIIRLGIPLKANQCLDPILDALTERHSRFIILCDRYRNCSNYNDCATNIESLFSEIETVATSIQESQGKQVWGEQTQAHNATLDNQDLRHRINGNQANVIMPGKGKGKDKGKGKGKSKGKGKGKGKGKQQTSNEWSGLCSKSGCGRDAKGYLLCLECHMYCMECATKAPTGTFEVYLKDGKTELYRKPNKGTKSSKGKDKSRTKGKKESFGFSKQQMQGLHLIGNHIKQAILGEGNQEEEQEQAIQLFNNNAYKRKNAFQARQNTNKRQKQVKFLDYVSNSMEDIE